MTPLRLALAIIIGIAFWVLMYVLASSVGLTECSLFDKFVTKRSQPISHYFLQQSITGKQDSLVLASFDNAEVPENRTLKLEQHMFGEFCSRYYRFEYIEYEHVEKLYDKTYGMGDKSIPETIYKIDGLKRGENSIPWIRGTIITFTSK